MTSFAKRAARVALHQMGGLSLFRRRHRAEFSVLMFHAFPEKDRRNVDEICAHIARHFQPLPLSAIVSAVAEGKTLPANALAVTIDDAYRSFLLHGHPIFRKHRIPTTVYAVSAFSAGRLWLWPDQVRFALAYTPLTTLDVVVGGRPFACELRNAAERANAALRLEELLKEVSDAARLELLARLGGLCRVSIPPAPPADRAAMDWGELRGVAAEDVEIGCHSATHPILSRVDEGELDREIRGARSELEERLGIPVRHFCYPNGRAIDISPAVIDCVRRAGFDSAVTTTVGFNTAAVDRFQIRRLPFDSSLPSDYGAELLAGLHL